MNERVPEPDESTLFYWEGARAGRLLIQRCASCGRYLGPRIKSPLRPWSTM